MPIRLLLPLLSALLLTACASAPEQPVQPVAPKPVTVNKPAAVVEAPLPSHMRELRGSLRTPPAGSDVEMALLVVDERDRPVQLLASTHLNGNGAVLPFSLRFSPTSIPAGQRLELRGRVSQAGILTLRLPARPIQPDSNQTLGALQLVPAP